MLMRRLSASLADDRSLQWLPLILVAVALGVMQAGLLPVRPIALDIPSTLGVLPGAAPEESIAPPSPAPVAVPSAILPSESQAPAVTPADRRTGTSTPCPPNAAADLTIAPRFLGSVTPSRATMSGGCPASWARVIRSSGWA